MFDPPATRSWEFPRQVAGVALLVAAGRDAGVAEDVLLRGSGLAGRDLADHQTEVTAQQELRVVRNLLTAAPSTTGVSVGVRYHASTFGPLGFALISSATLGDAANLTFRFLDLSFTFSVPSASLDGDQVVIGVDDRGLPADVRRFLVERDLTAIWTVLREIAGGAPRLTSVALPHEPTEVAPYRAAFGVRPTWTSSGRAEMRLDAAWLDHPLPQANPHAFAMAESLCRDLVANRRSRSGVVEDVRILVAQRLADGAPMGAVAAALGLSERSLRRHLTDAGTSYRGVLDEVRRSAAEELLADRSLRVDDVAHQLGYAEATSFGAAYRRWTGRSPRA
ncbi:MULTISPECIES: AraC family transcriptional regulator [unclassified Nocardioides]|uniref:AraC family transcriptional regulator n=1 Tax=unclassified Nocardioides TaxID=2615069 RepID=UPI0004907141|nr:MULTISPECIES: AraC family transcriptional regulator [unclassified Nocardioides]